MEIIRYSAPFECEEVLNLWEKIFGKDEALLETPQVDGTEQEENVDIVYAARENGRLLGTVHATISKSFPELCGISAVCTEADVRGCGIGRMLLTIILEELDALGVKTMFLGTGNYAAAKLYHSLGFSFLPYSSVMARFAPEKYLIDFMNEFYTEEPVSFHISEGSASMRIPIIPLILQRSPFAILDCNTDLISCTGMPQTSCMSLYPRYLTLAAEGGSFWGAFSEKKVLGAVASVKETECGRRADFFCSPSFFSAAEKLLEQCEKKCGPVYLQIAKRDTAKRRMAEQAGYHAEEEVPFVSHGMVIPCLIYVK